MEIECFIQYYHDSKPGLYSSGFVAISEWKCSNLIYLTILSFLSVFRCHVAHSPDLGMIIIGLRSTGCNTYVHKYTHVCTHEWRCKRILQFWFWNLKKWFISCKICKSMYQRQSPFLHTHNTKGQICVNRIQVIGCLHYSAPYIEKFYILFHSSNIRRDLWTWESGKIRRPILLTHVWQLNMKLQQKYSFAFAL